MKSEIFVRFVSGVAKKVSCLKDMILKKINDKGALLFALFILLAGGSRARQHRKDDHVIRGKQVAVFGRNIFTVRNLSFEPSLDIPTPENYVLGSGDELIIDVWGASENTVREIISPEGTIHVAGIGPIFGNRHLTAAAEGTAMHLCNQSHFRFLLSFLKSMGRIS